MLLAESLKEQLESAHKCEAAAAGNLQAWKVGAHFGLPHDLPIWQHDFTS